MKGHSTQKVFYRLDVGGKRSHDHGVSESLVVKATLALASLMRAASTPGLLGLEVLVFCPNMLCSWSVARQP